MSRFAYFEYRGTFPPYAPGFGQPYHYVVKVTKFGSDGREGSSDELLRGARILISNKLAPETAEVLAGTPPTEISPEQFDRMTKEEIRHSTMPGDVYRVRDY